MRFDAASWLPIASLLAAGALALALGADRRRQRTLAATFHTPLLDRLLQSVDPTRRAIRRILWTLGLLALGIAFARPQWGRSEIEIERTGIDVVVALDASRSMLAPDAGGTNRLEAARQAIRRWIEPLGGDRLGLVVFAGEAFVAAPLTRDHSAFLRSLDAAGPASVSQAGSDLSTAIERATECFERGAQGPRVLLVVSDGEQLQGEAAAAARKAATAGVRVHTAGVGSVTGARLPPRSGGTDDFLRNPAGREVVSRRDEQQLERIAAAGGGRYTRLDGPHSNALRDWFRATSAGLPRTTEKRTIDEPRERFQWPLALALVLLSSEWLLGERRRPRTDRTPRTGRTRFARNRPDPALIAAMVCTLVLNLPLLAGSPATHDTQSTWDTYNDAVRAYAAARYAEAFEKWQELALEPLPRGLRSPVPFQLGNVQFRLGEPLEAAAPEQAAEWWRRSLEAYSTVLERSPHHAPARHNYDLVRQRLARLTHRLGLELFRAAESQPLDPAIDLLRPSLAQLEAATALAPEAPDIRADRDRAVTALRERLAKRSAQTEAKGDQEAARKSQWNDPLAVEHYRNALDDLAEARREPEPQPAAQNPHNAAPHSSPPNQSLADVESRVNRKLADVLTRMGQREQQAGNTDAQPNPDEAIDHYESALDRFAEALQTLPDHPPALEGQREVQAALEQLHVRRGQEQLEQGRERLARQRPDAAPPLADALGNFESAQSLNPANADAREGAEEARRLLPEALALAGQEQMAAGDRAETRSATEALGHFQEAETSFEQALGIQPDQAQARRGLDELEPRLARLRDRVAREAEEAARQNLLPSQRSATLQSLLGQANEREPERPAELDRQRQRGRKQTGVRRNPFDW